MQHGEEDQYITAAKWLRSADGLLITAGAGMGVDSGLPDFRGDEGLWKAYPALGEKNISFVDIANPEAFERNPKLAWGFYGHRLELYRETEPHAGFDVLMQIAGALEHGCFVFTSNVDGQFQKAGFSPDAIVERHGSIHHFQCSNGCSENLWKMDSWVPEVNTDTLELTGELPCCPHCSALSRPNILMFDDDMWVSNRYLKQKLRLKKWMDRVKSLVVIEIGAGITIPTVRHFSEFAGGPLIRINLREEQLGAAWSGVGISGSGLSVLKKLAGYL